MTPSVGLLLWLLAIKLIVGDGVDDESTSELSVTIGRETSIHPRHLNIDVNPDDVCKIEVNAYDHLSLRVGNIEPKTFDCGFQAGQVRYIHSGSPLLNKDTISLRVYRFSAGESTVADLRLTIHIKHKPYAIFHKVRPVRVKRFNGLSNPIDGSVLRFRYDVEQNATCMVGFSRYSTPWPSAGQIVVSSKGKPVDSLWRDCHEFQAYGLRYQHLVPPTPKNDFLPLKVQVYLPYSGIIIERMYLPIQIDDAFPNMAPKTSFVNSNLLEVDQFVMTVLSPTVMGAEDNETPQASLVYNITKPLGRGQGYLVHLADRTQPITSFLQSDLTNQNIAYQPPMIPYPDPTDFHMEVTIFDSSFASSQPVKFHISVRPTHTDAPGIAVNSGLVVLEGGKQPIRTTDLLVVDNDLSTVHIYVKGGLQHGSLTINDRPIVSFTPRDIELGQVIYQHDDSDSTSDSLTLKISDGINNVQTRLHIHIVAKDDTAPIVVSKNDLDIQEGETVQIRDSTLFAQDEDSNDDDITYVVTRNPMYGELIRKTSPTSEWIIINKFTQREILSGFIHYRQYAKDSLLDSVIFVVQDKQDPPNISPEYMLMVRIRPPYNAPPRRIRGTEESITTKETDVVYIDKYRLGYEDPDTIADNIVYTITAQPYFVSSQESVDAGKLISMRNRTSVLKDDSIPSLVTFTQADVDHMKIAYMPPKLDIGPDVKHARFIYTVSDDTGNILNGLSFQINIEPVNNQSPEFLVNPLSVHEGDSTGVTVRQISVIDVDTKPDDILLMLDTRPNRGIVKFDGKAMDIGDKFTLKDVGRSRISYSHDGSDEVDTDSFNVRVSDGVQSVTKAIPVNVILVNDQPPVLEPSATRQMWIDEGGEMAINTKILSATDGDTPADSIRFTIIKTPSKGAIVDGDTLVSRFTQNDMEKGRIKYVHNGKEIGPENDNDSFLFILSDKPISTVEDHPVYFVNITIKPVNNHSPSLILGNPLIVLEAGRTKITLDILAAKDVDSTDEYLKFVILKHPDWGHIENANSAEGSEISSKGGKVTEFFLSDIRNKTITYVQSRHEAVEPISDTMTLKVTDGQFFSAETLLVITIIPQNDEIPEILLESLNVTHGYDNMIGSELLMVTDADLPPDVCIISVPILPAHGHLTMLVPVSGRDGMVQVPVHEFTMNDVKKGVRLLYKHYGGDANTDSLMIKVSDGRHSVEREVRIDIVKIDDERPEVVKNSGLKLYYGDVMSHITSTALQAIDRDTPEDNIVYIIVNRPSRGKLQKRKRVAGPIHSVNEIDDNDELQKDQAILQTVPDWEEVDEGMNFTQTDLNENLVRYVHNGEIKETSTDKFRFRVTDGVSTSPKETFEISLEKPKVSDIELMVRNIKVKGGRAVRITTRELSATDGSDMFNRLTFIITKQPHYGHIELDKDAETPARNFTQLDLSSQRVEYVHTSTSDAVEDRFQFIVTNGVFLKNGTMYILIIPNDRITPTLDKNNVLFIAKGKQVTITSDYLNAKDPDTSTQNLTFMVMKLPDYGGLLVGDSQVTQEFYQSDVDEGRISYRHYGVRTGTDQFWFAVSDRKHIGFLVNDTLQLTPAQFRIEVTETEYRPPTILYSRAPKILDTFSQDRVGYLITSRLLKVTSTFDPPENLRFLLIEQPRNGHLENLVTGQELGYSFTQADLDNDAVVFFVNPASNFSNDSFIFTVEDSRRNVMNPIRYTMSWPVVQFRQASYVVCEDVGRLAIPIARHGNIGQQSYINIKVRAMSADEGKDFQIPTISQVQFDEGVSEVTWNLEIYNDDLLEKNEKMKLILKSPINAFLGSINRTSITIVNKNTATGACAPVKGILLRDEISLTSDAKSARTIAEPQPNNAKVSVVEENKSSWQKPSTVMVPQRDAAAAAQNEQASQKANSLLEDLASRIPLIAQPNGASEAEDENGEDLHVPQAPTLVGVSVDPAVPTILSIDKVTMRKAFNRLEEDTSGRIAGKVKKKKGGRKKNKDDRQNVGKETEQVEKEVRKKPGNKDQKGKKRREREERRRERLEQRRQQRERNRRKKNGKKKDKDNNGEERGNARKDRERRKNGGGKRRNGNQKEQNRRSSEDVVIEQKPRDSVNPVLMGIPTQPTPPDDKQTSVLSDSKNSDSRKPTIDSNLRSQVIQQWSSLEANANTNNDTNKAIGGCNPSTKGFYHKDPGTNQVYRCDGYGWLTITDIRLPSPDRYNRRRSEEPIITGEDMDAQASQCPDDWVMFSGRCYLSFEEKATWDEATAECTKLGASLPSIWAEKQSMWLISLVGKRRMWIGLTDKGENQKWTYINDDPVTYTNWREGFPQEGKSNTNNKQCVMISRDLSWSNRPCSGRKAKFVCTKLPASINRRFDLS